VRAYFRDMKAVAYVRVSSRGQNVASQRDAILRAAEARGDTITDWYVEKRTATTLKREELALLRADVKAGKVRKLYVFRIDRLSRSGIRDMFEVVEEFRDHGCTIATTADAFSVEGPHATIVLAVLALCAQMEREALGERISAARVKVEASGGRWGRPRTVDPGTRQKAKQLKADGKTIRQISAALKVPRSTLARALSQKGHYSPKGPGPKKTRLAG
jgi:DNA invertase Pin-like site-specific DNA recombinase